jgi:hypothetical protein
LVSCPAFTSRVRVSTSGAATFTFYVVEIER